MLLARSRLRPAQKRRLVETDHQTRALHADLDLSRFDFFFNSSERIFSEGSNLGELLIFFLFRRLFGPARTANHSVAFARVSLTVPPRMDAIT